MLTDEIKDLQEIVNYTMKCLAESTTEKEKQYFLKEYKRVAAILREKEDAWANFLAYEAI